MQRNGPNDRARLQRPVLEDDRDDCEPARARRRIAREPCSAMFPTIALGYSARFSRMIANDCEPTTTHRSRTVQLNGPNDRARVQRPFSTARSRCLSSAHDWHRIDHVRVRCVRHGPPAEVAKLARLASAATGAGPRIGETSHCRHVPDRSPAAKQVRRNLGMRVYALGDRCRVRKQKPAFFDGARDRDLEAPRGRRGRALSRPSRVSARGP